MLATSGARRRPVRRCLPSCQCGRLVETWRRAGHCRRRPCGQVIDIATPDRARVQSGDDAGALPG